MKKKTSTANPVKVEIESLLCAIKKRRQQPDGFGNLLFAGQHRHTIAVLRAIAAQSSFRFSVWFLLPDFQEKSSQNDIKMPQHFVMRGFISHRIRNHRNTRHALLPIAILDRNSIYPFDTNKILIGGINCGPCLYIHPVTVQDILDDSSITHSKTGGRCLA